MQSDKIDVAPAAISSENKVRSLESKLADTQAVLQKTQQAEADLAKDKAALEEKLKQQDEVTKDVEGRCMKHLQDAKTLLEKAYAHLDETKKRFKLGRPAIIHFVTKRPERSYVYPFGNICIL